MKQLVGFTYNCPECERKIDRVVEYMEPSLFKTGEPVQLHAFWCVYCDAKQEAKLMLLKKDKGFVLTTLSLTSNDRKILKKLKIKK